MNQSLEVRAILRHNVPRFIQHIKGRGGVNQEEWQWLKYEDDENPDYPMGLMSRADILLLYPENEEIL